jgi:hypothetical protein
MSQKNHTHASIKAAGGSAKDRAAALAEMQGASPANPLSWDKAYADAQLVVDGDSGVTVDEVVDAGVVAGVITPQEQPA